MDNVKYNQLSDQLIEEVQKALPQPGQVIWFQSVRPKSRGTTVLPYDRIFDPWAGENGKYVDIAYITGHEPAKGPGGQPKEVLGRIQFSRQSQGRIGIRGGQKADEQLFAYLYLTNQLKNNVGKPWFIRGKNSICEMVEPAKNAAKQLEHYELFDMAYNAIRRMPEVKLRELALGLDMKHINSHSTPDEIRIALVKIANKDPKKITTLDKDVQLGMKILINRAERAGVIKRDDALKMYVWPDTGEQICIIPPGKGAIEALTSYFLGKGVETYHFVKKLTEQKEEGILQTTPPELKKREKTGGRQKGTPNKEKPVKPVVLRKSELSDPVTN